MPSLRERAFWSIYAKVYDLAWDSPLTSSTASLVASHLDAPRVVDLGVGTGLFSAAIHHNDAAVTGVDSSKAMLKRAVRRARVDVGIAASATRTGLPSHSFDAAVCANLLHLAHDTEAVVREAVRLVRPGGLVAWVFPAAGVTPRRVLAADVAAGRSRPTAVLAHVVREQVRPPALAARLTVRTGEEVARLLAERGERLKWSVVEDTTVFGVQHVTIVRLP